MTETEQAKDFVRRKADQIRRGVNLTGEMGVTGVAWTKIGWRYDDTREDAELIMRTFPHRDFVLTGSRSAE